MVYFGFLSKQDGDLRDFYAAVAALFGISGEKKKNTGDANISLVGDSASPNWHL